LERNGGEMVGVGFGFVVPVPPEILLFRGWTWGQSDNQRFT